MRPEQEQCLSLVHIASDFSQHKCSYSYHVNTFNQISQAARYSLHNHHPFGGAVAKHSVTEPVNIQSDSLLTACLPATPARPSANTRARSLMIDAVTTAIDDEMTALASEPPGSPPGLTGSKSSKSSSYHSSSLSGADAILSEITHFEDLGLDGEDLPSLERNLHGMEKNTRPPAPRMSATTMSGGPRSNSAAMTTLRELTNQTRKSTYPNSLGPPKGHAASHSFSLPYGAGMRTSLRNASTPSLAITAMSNSNRSRSPSPNPPSPLPRLLPGPKSSRRPGLAPVELKRPPIRRGSWQPNRKTVKELEAEYNDADEDLPDDASLWNVPLSPRPPPERTSISRTTSPKDSPCASPERPSPLRTAIGMDSTQAPKTAPALAASRPSPEALQSSTFSTRRPPVRGASTGTMPDHFGHPAGRTKSWNVALSELSEEAKALTETLENHAGEAERRHEEAVQNGEVPLRPSLDALSRAKTSIIDLPPLRMNNVMIDPLPISKEKEKVLSRTRPSWLPPKSQKEEKKHLKEYQRMMEFSLEAERRKAAKMADNQCVKDDTKSALLRIWEEHVLPNWDQVIREPRTRELWWRGVAPKSRAQVWQRAIGNDLAMTDVTYRKALQRAKNIEKRLPYSTNGEYARESAWFDAIRRDVKVTFPDLNIFQPGGPLHEELVDVLMAYSMYRSDVGYSHGTHLTAALLTLTLPTPSSTFLTLANLLNRPLPLAFLTGDASATSKTYTLTLTLLAQKYPRLHSHLFGPAPSSLPPATIGLGLSPLPPISLHLHPALLLEPLFRTLFLGPHGGLGLDIAARVWDVMVFDGDAAVIRTAVAVLGGLEGRLYGGREEVLGVLGWGGGGGGGNGGNGGKGWDVGSEEAFMRRVREVGKEGRGL